MLGLAFIYLFILDVDKHFVLNSQFSMLDLVGTVLYSLYCALPCINKNSAERERHNSPPPRPGEHYKLLRIVVERYSETLMGST